MALRVIAGEAGGRRLVAPRSGTRPTTDRVREALFASLGPRVEGAAVADLFAGSGALGIEALSRGAGRAVFVDDDRAAVTAIRENLDSTGLSGRARVERSPVRAFLGSPAAEEPFDLVLLDPPYGTGPGEWQGLFELLERRGRLADGALVVVERRRGGPVLVMPTAWKTRSERTYGDTLLLVATVARREADTPT